MSYKENNLENLPSDIMKIILQYCDYDSLINCKVTSKFFKDNIEKNLLIEKLRHKRKLNKIQKISNFFPTFFKKLLNFSNIQHAKLVKLGKNLGYTDYIDFLTLNHFAKQDTNIIYGRDVLKRFFISIMYDVDNDYYHEYKTNNIITFFQRLSENDTYYVICGDSFYERGIVNTHDFNNNKNDEQIRIFFELLNNGKSNYKKNDINLNYVLSEI